MIHMSTNKSNKPELRFKGFSDDWEQRKVGDCFLSLQNNTLSRAELSDENGTVMNVHYGDVLTKFSECLDVSKDRLPFIKKQFFMDKFKTSYLKNGDVIVSDTAEDETVGKCIEIIGMTNQKVLSGLHTIPLRPKEQFATGYLGFYLNSSAYHRQLKPLMQGIKVTSISKSAMLDTVIKYPSDIWEQTLIGQYFMSLDNLITLHQRKCDNLKIIKKSMLDNLFPKIGEKVPKWRFKGFNNDWEQRKLSDFAIKAVDNRGKTPPLSEEGTHPLIEVAALGNGHPDYSKVEKYLDDYSFRHNLRDYIKEGDILFSTVGSIGLVSLMDSHENAAIAQNIVAFRAKQGYLPKFLYSLFSTAENQERANRIVMGAVQPSIKVSQLVDVEYYVTNNIKEQRMLGEMFYNLDNLITLHQSEVERLKKAKQFFLDKMFI